MFEWLRRRSRSAIFACAVGIALLAAAFASTAAPAAVAGPGIGAEASKPPAGLHGADRGGEIRRGIVQALSAKAVTLKELDGTTLNVAVDARTRVFVDGKPALLRDVEPGFVAIARGNSGKPALELRTFDLSPPHGLGGAAVRGAVVKSVSAVAVVLNKPDGNTVTVRVDAKTRVFIDDRRASLSDVELGFVVASPKAFKSNKPAKELRFLRPG